MATAMLIGAALRPARGRRDVCVSARQSGRQRVSPALPPTVSSRLRLLLLLPLLLPRLPMQRMQSQSTSAVSALPLPPQWNPACGITKGCQVHPGGAGSISWRRRSRRAHCRARPHDGVACRALILNATAPIRRRRRALIKLCVTEKPGCESRRRARRLLDGPSSSASNTVSPRKAPLTHSLKVIKW